jgi:hypothetical protein
VALPDLHRRAVCEAAVRDVEAEVGTVQPAPKALPGPERFPLLGRQALVTLPDLDLAPSRGLTPASRHRSGRPYTRIVYRSYWWSQSWFLFPAAHCHLLR